MRDANLPITGEKGNDLSATRLSGLSDTWMKALENRRQLEARYNAALQANSRGDAVNIPDIVGNPIYVDAVKQNRERRAKLQDDIRVVEKQIQELEAQKQANATKWTNEHPEMRKLNAQIDALKQNVESMKNETATLIDEEQKKTEKTAINSTIISLKSQLDAASTQEAQSKAAYDQEAQTSNAAGIGKHGTYHPSP